MGKTIRQTVTFDADPAALFQLYLDPKQHAAALGEGVKISAKEGARFSAYDGYIVGKNLQVVPNELIVQSWRATDWKPSDPDSVLVLQFAREGKKTKLEVTHSNVPARQAAQLDQGWKEYYWKPFKAYLKAAGR